ncbi:MAG: D-glycero-beta-D-manno-heptose 1-phosphate adenylyltransferase [Dehalococcoidia bacterium]
MDNTLPRLLDAFRRLHVGVIGDAMLDSYLEGTSNRLCREAPVPIVSVSTRMDAAGGAANTAVNVRALGPEVTFLSVLGDDPEGDILRAVLEQGGVSTDALIITPARRTLAKHRVVAASQLLVRFDQGSTEDIDRDIEQTLIGQLQKAFSRCDAIIVSDYGYGVLTSAVIQALAVLQRGNRKLLVVDSKNLPAYQEACVTAVKPNYEESVRLLGLEKLERAGGRAAQMATHGQRLLDLTGSTLAAVTLDSEGAIIFDRSGPHYRTYARPTRDSRAAGAGDTFISALTMALAAGAETPAATELASAAAAVVVAKDGTSVCSAAELQMQIALGEKYSLEPAALSTLVASYRRQGRRIVFTNGCFDILHRGHVTYLSRAKALGDILIVGVNSDQSVERLKGQGRPINSLEDRVQVLAALSCVDHIVSFDEDTPSNLIRAIWPDIFAKGGDYTRDTLPEAPLVEAQGGKVHLLPYLEDRSTTTMIERIRSVYSQATVAGSQRLQTLKVDSE